LLFPVFFRDPRPLGAEFEILVIATASPLAAMITSRFFLYAMSSHSPSMKIRQVAIGAFFIAGISILWETGPAMTYPEAYRSPLTARMVGWSPGSEMPHREQLLPLDLLRSSASEPGQVLHSRGWENHLEAYRAMGLLDGIETTPDSDAATVAIRLVPPVAANRFASFIASYPPPLPDTQTRLAPEPHRPLFFIDE
jgi:hypothetical protein